ncbi:lysophospholipid acyltransferase family protein [Robiginitalea sp.]|uniref:lysophospholipid acyltransferase family protein n=1 Tax=Robiginitalea sp. TaxID=1902411 RepID=UPI003C711B58
MERIISYPLSGLYILLFGLTLIVFHPIQWLCLNLFGYEAHRMSVALLNLCLMRCTHLLGTSYTFRNKELLPDKGPAIIVANHQSMYDIPPIIWRLRRLHPKFVSKKELGRGIPSVSYNLRHGGSALIDRQDRRQSLTAIRELGEYIERTGRSAVIFPEGTRSRDGNPKAFRMVGLKVLIKSAPSAQIIPVSINNSWKILRFGKFPYGLGARLEFIIHPTVPAAGCTDKELEEIEATIASAIKVRL